MKLTDFTRIRTWLHGLAAAVIGGVATNLAAAYIVPGSVSFSAEGLKHMAQLAGSTGLIYAFLYLKKSPIWDSPQDCEQEKPEAK